MRSRRRADGFTLVELMLAMAFVSMLLLAIAMTVIGIMHIYTKGLTMKAVNQAGRDVVADMKRTVGEGQVFTVGSKDGASPTYGMRPPFVLQKNLTGDIQTAITDDSFGGRFCTGNYSYIWNIGRRATATDWPNKYDGTPTEMPRLVKVKDSGAYCSIDGSGKLIKDKIESADNPTELLSEADLAIQDFQVEQLSGNLSAGQALYKFTVRIASANSEALTTVGECRPPSGDVGLEDFCSVNDFVFTVKISSIGG